MNYKLNIFLITTFLFKSIIVFAQGGVISPKHDGSAIRFIENKGQFIDEVVFEASLQTGRLFISPTELNYVFLNEEDLQRNYASHTTPSHGETRLANFTRGHAYRVKFLNANKNPNVKGDKLFAEYYNYFIGNDKSKWASKVNLYNTIRHKNLYPNIDMELLGQGQNLKYNLIVQPKGNPKKIEIEYSGVDELFIEENGDLHINTSVNKIVETRPYAYQMINGITIEVPCNFVLEGNIVRFNFPRGYKKKYTLVIDPALIFASLSGSTGDNWGNTATYDNQGHLYTGGLAYGNNVFFPTTLGAFQLSHGGGTNPGGTDMAISKYSINGDSLLYSTYLGGRYSEVPHSLIVNSKNELLIYGTTESDNFPIPDSVNGLPYNAHDNSFNGGVIRAAVPAAIGGDPGMINAINFTNLGSDIILAVLSEDGSALLGATYMGGSDNDGINYTPSLTYNFGDQFRGEINLNKKDYCYVVSTTMSSDFDTLQPLQNSFGGGQQDACFFKFSPYLDTLIFSSYWGGEDNDAGYGIALNDNNDFYICGGTQSSLFPNTADALHPNYQGGNADGFVSKISATGSSMLASTYLGSSAHDEAYFVQLDTGSQVYIFGQSLGPYAEPPNGIFHNPNGKQFIHKLNDSLTTTVFSANFGSNSAVGDISPSAFSVNTCENILLSGWGGNLPGQPGNTFGLPTSVGAYQSATDGSDFYFMVLSKDAASLLYATYYGTSGSNEHVDGGTSRFDPNGIVYQSVCAGCQGRAFPTTPGAFSEINGSSNCNNGVIKFDFTALKANFFPDKFTGCDTTIFKFTNQSLGGVNFNWDFGDGTDSTVSDTSFITHQYDTAGIYTIRLIAVDMTTCKGTDTSFKTVEVFSPNISANAFPDTTICPGDNVQLNSTGGVSYVWSPGLTLNDSTLQNPTAIPDSPTVYIVIVTDSNGCVDYDTLLIKFSPFVTSNFNHTAEFVISDTIYGVNSNVQFTNLSTSADSFSWDFGDGTTSTGKNPQHSYKTEGKYKICLTAINSISGCVDVYCDNLQIIKGQIYVPTAFSPNGDGENDEHFVKGKGVIEYNINIFNRWGQLVYESNDFRGKWNGTFNGKLQEMEVYVYHIRAKLIQGTDFEEKGNISLIH